MKYGYSIDAIVPGAVSVTYFRDGYPEKKTSITFNNSLDEDGLHLKVHKNRPKEFWAAVDAREASTHLRLQHLVGSTHTVDQERTDDRGTTEERGDGD